MYNIVMGFVYCFFYINLKEGHTRYRLLLFYTLMVTQNIGSLFMYVLISDTELQKKTWSIALTICILMGTVVGKCMVVNYQNFSYTLEIVILPCTQKTFHRKISGMGAMILYYRFFHSTGPISWTMSHNDIELNNKSLPQQNNKQNNTALKQVRSFKNSQRPQTTNSHR